LFPFIVSCSKDSEVSSSNITGLNPPLITRSTISPGSYTVTASGILNFPTEVEFHQTVSYISSDTSHAQLSAFRTSLSIETISKKATMILDSIESENLFVNEISIRWPDFLNYIDTAIQQGDAHEE